MQILTLIFCILAISISSMDLSLAILWGRKASLKWSKFLIVFAASIIGVVFSYAIVQVSALFENTLAMRIFRYIWDVLFHIDIAFLIVFIPIFINWVIARPVSIQEKLIFIFTSISFASFYILYSVLDDVLFRYLQYLCFCLIVVYAIIIMAMNVRKSTIWSVKAVSVSIISVSAASLLIFLLAYFFPSFTAVSIPLVILLYFIMVLVFLFIAISNQESRNEKKDDQIEIEKSALKDQIIERYHITEREWEIIKLIKTGLTNKEIGAELNISVNTVNNHIANIFSKTSVRCRIDLLNLFEEASW